MTECLECLTDELLFSGELVASHHGVGEIVVAELHIDEVRIYLSRVDDVARSFVKDIAESLREVHKLVRFEDEFLSAFLEEDRACDVLFHPETSEFAEQHY